VRIVLADVIEQGGNDTLKLIQDLGAEAVFIRTDVSNAEDVNAAVAKAVSTYGRLDCAFNNAGIEGQFGATDKCTRENWDRVIAIDLTGVFLCMQAELQQMLKQGSGAIVNTSSGAGLAGVKGMPAYVAAKHGVAGLTRAAALEYGRVGIRINAVCPGPIRTPMMGRITNERPDTQQRFAGAAPMKRLGEPEEIGEAVAWLCSDHASYVTGLPMPVDGGFMAA